MTKHEFDKSRRSFILKGAAALGAGLTSASAGAATLFDSSQTLQDQMNQLQEKLCSLEDREALRQLHLIFITLLENKAYEAVVDLFAEDAVVELHDMKLAGKCSIVTGAGRGIGKAIAARLLQEGSTVFICDLVEERTRLAVEELRQYGEVDGISGDVTDAGFCSQLVEEASKIQGDLEVLVNNAGTARFSSFLDHTQDDWDFTLKTNLTSVFLMGQKFARYLVERGSGGSTSRAGAMTRPTRTPGSAWPWPTPSRALTASIPAIRSSRAMRSPSGCIAMAWQPCAARCLHASSGLAMA